MKLVEKDHAWIELDMEALRHNVEFLRSRLPEGCELMPAVKANAYGHGALPVGRELESLGVRAFCVATVHEGAELRQGGVKGDILVLGYTHESELALIEQYDLIQTAVDLEHARLIDAYGKRLRVHLALDTGMHRLGESAMSPDRLEQFCRLKNLRLEGAFTHLCTGDRAYSGQQAEAFRAAVRALRRQGCPIKKAHLLSSTGILKFPELGGDYARVGIALYGLGSTREEKDRSLRPVLSLKARVASVREIKKGQGAGYGLRYRAEQDACLAVLTIGYADGLPRALSCGGGGVLLGGQYAPIAGMICMDQTLVDVTALPHVRQGDEAVLIGCQGERTVSAYDWAEAAGTITNEIVSRLGTRLARLSKEA